MSRFRWGIFGTGAISAKFVQGLAAAAQAEASFVASRSLARAQTLARACGIPRAIEGYARAASEGGVNAVYIATPPSEHAAHAMLCIEAGIPVLVEKPFAADAAAAAAVADAARARGVFAMEAIWTRFLPAAQALRDRLSGGARGAGGLGTVRLVSGNFGVSFRPDRSNSMFDPALGGGAVAHLGSYPLSLAQWLFGTPADVQAVGTYGPTGVEEDAAFQLCYPGDILASFFVSIRAWAPDAFTIMGTDGMVEFRGSIVRPFGLRVTRQAPRAADVAQFGLRARLRQHALVHRLAQHLGRSSRDAGRAQGFHYAGNGYHYQADEVRACIRRGAQESDIMPLRDSIAVAVTAEAIRKAIADQSNQGMANQGMASA